MNSSLSVLYKEPLRKPDEVVDSNYYIWLELYPSGEPYLYVTFRDRHQYGRMTDVVITYSGMNSFVLHILDSRDFCGPDGTPIRDSRNIEVHAMQESDIKMTIQRMFTDFYIKRDLLEAAANE